MVGHRYLTSLRYPNETRNLKDKLHHVPCLGHIVNLAVQAILGPAGLNDQPLENVNLYPGDDEDQRGTEQSQTTLMKLRRGIVKIRYNAHISFSATCIAASANCGDVSLLTV